MGSNQALKEEVMSNKSFKQGTERRRDKGQEAQTRHLKKRNKERKQGTERRDEGQGALTKQRKKR